MSDLILYGGIAAAIAIVVVLALMYEKGYIGGKPRLVAMIAATEAYLEKLRARLQKKIDAEAAKQAQSVPGVILHAPSKAERIAENQALLAAGTITQADFDAAKTAILNS